MTYIDTSVLVAYYCPETLSERVDQIVEELQQPVISLLVEVELHSALARKVREGNLSRENGIDIRSQFQSHIQQRLYRKVPVETEHFRTARDWISHFASPLRTLDGLHLAIAWTNGLKLLTADSLLAKSAKEFEVDVQLITD
jgi:predicted nucleic acid-binding protein